MNDGEMDFVIKLIKNLNKVYPYYDVKCDFPAEILGLVKLTVMFGKRAEDLNKH